VKNRIVSVSLAIAFLLSVGLIGCGGEAVTETQEYALTISSTEGGSVTAPGEGTGSFTYHEGEVVNLVVEAGEGYRFVKWTGDVGTIDDVEDATTTITMNDDYEITANFGDNFVGGPISQNTTWQGGVSVTDWVIVKPDVTLTILPGTRVIFQHYRGYRELGRRLGMEVEGSIVAIGTAAQPIYFTSDAADPQNGDWSMLRLVSPTGPTRFHYCVFEFAQQGLNVWQSSPEIARSVFRWNNWEGVYFESYSQPTLDYCQIYENGYNGVAAEQSNVVTTDYCEIWNNGTNGVHIDNSAGEVRQSRIHDNHANGLSVDDSGTLRAFGDAIYDNQDCGIGIGEGSNTIQVSNLNIYGNAGEICGAYTTITSAYSPPTSIDIGFVPEQSYALGYIPGDQRLDEHMYVYPDDETRRIVRKIGTGLGLTWSLAWHGQYIWTGTLCGHIYKLNPQTGEVLDDFILHGSPTWGRPSQPWVSLSMMKGICGW
jgi:hypothetical protein